MKSFPIVLCILLFLLIWISYDYMKDPLAEKFTPVLLKGRVHPLGVVGGDPLAFPPDPQFPLFPPSMEGEIKLAYALMVQGPTRENIRAYTNLLQKGYRQIEGLPMVRSTKKTLLFPSREKIVAEYYLSTLPMTACIIVFYVLAVLLYVSFPSAALVSCLIGFTLQSILLLGRCYILNRPPVSNMYETLLYVPWVTVTAALALRTVLGSSLILPVGAAAAALILITQQATGMDRSLQNVQAVLDSQFWLIIHVLMVVGSYGLFVLAGMLGHIYLIKQYWMKETFSEKIAQLMIQSIYLGTALLICGTVLGGVWAAQSWGRFWDWDPKESWAFISSCIYLVWIHAYRFHKIGTAGLAVGSIVGLHAIIFTWYGVNYILGTGMHSYGFGSGGEAYYYSFLVVDLLFLAFSWTKGFHE